MKKLLSLFFLLSYFVFPQIACAVTITINNSPSSVSTEAFNIDVSVLGASGGQNYIRADLYKEGTTNYFGETFNGSSWYKGSNGAYYFPITIVDTKTTASANLQVRIGSPTSTQLPGSGTYKLKIRRYTSSGNAAGSDDVTPVDILINYSLPTTPTPTSKPLTSTTTTTKSTSVKTSTPTKTPTVIKSANNSNVSNSNVSNVNQKKIINNSDKIATDFAKVQNLTQAQNKKSEVDVLGESENEFPWSLGLPIGGLLFLLVGFGLFAKNNWRQIKIWMENL